MNAQSPNVALRAALYLRVSTSRQAEHDVSIPDQRRQGEAWCEARGYQLVETFVEAGASATNDRRPEFQRMIEAGTSKPAPFDIVVVHSFSRFFRDHFELEFYVRKLAKKSDRNTIKMTPQHVIHKRLYSQSPASFRRMSTQRCIGKFIFESFTIDHLNHEDISQCIQDGLVYMGCGFAPEACAFL